MKTITFLLLICLVVMLTGCPKNIPNKPELLNKAISLEIARFDADLLTYECAATGERFSRNGSYETCSTGSRNITRAREVRNDVVDRLIGLVDTAYFEFEDDLYKRRTSGSFLADVTDISLGLATTITNGERAKTVLGAILTAFRGGRKSGSINFYREQTAELIITKMQTSRNRILTDIIKKIQDDTNSERINYSLYAALNDVVKYFYAGTLHRAFQQLQEDTNNDAKNAKENLRTVTIPSSRKVTPEAFQDSTNAVKTLQILEIAVGNPKTNEAAVKKLQEIYKELQTNANVKKAIEVLKINPEGTNGNKLIEGIKEIRRKLDDDNDEDSVDFINKTIVVKGQLNP